MTKSDAVFQSAQRAHEEPPEDGIGFLADKPKGFCPWCGNGLRWPLGDGEDWGLCPAATCSKWDPTETENANRARYVAEQQAEAKHEERLARESRKRGGEW